LRTNRRLDAALHLAALAPPVRLAVLRATSPRRCGAALHQALITVHHRQSQRSHLRDVASCVLSAMSAEGGGPTTGGIKANKPPHVLPECSNDPDHLLHRGSGPRPGSDKEVHQSSGLGLRRPSVSVTEI
jgi:hypothetical protein